METEGVPWLFALLTAAWFWWMANRANRTRTLWAVGGGAFGIVAIVALLFAYLKFDTATKGYYTRWLQVAIGLVTILTLVALAAIFG